MTILCDICDQPAEPMQGLYGAPGDGGKIGPRIGFRRHYQCHIDKYGKPIASYTTRPTGYEAAPQEKRTIKMTKRPFVTKGEHNRSPNAERKFTTTGRVVSEMGRRRIEIECPFCNSTFWAYPWSLAGVGKKCPNCRAMFNKWGTAAPLIGNEEM